MPGGGAGATVPTVVGWPAGGPDEAAAGGASRPALRRMAERAHGSLSTSTACTQSFIAGSDCPSSERAVPRLNHALAKLGDNSIARVKSSTAGPYCPALTRALPRSK